MDEIILKLTADQYSVVHAAMNDSRVYQMFAFELPELLVLYRESLEKVNAILLEKQEKPS